MRISKIASTSMVMALAAAFMMTSFSAVADEWWDEPLSGLPNLQTLHERPDDADGDTAIAPPFANIQEDNYAAPFQWGGTYTDQNNMQRTLPALPLAGASWWVAIDSTNDPGELFDSFDLRYYQDDEGEPGAIINQQTVDFDWLSGPTVTLVDSAEEEDVDWDFYRIGASSGSGFYNAWAPQVTAGDNIWFNVRSNTGSSWDDGGDDRIRWLRGAEYPTVGAPLEGYAVETEAGAWETTDVPLAHSQHVVPEPASMTLLGLGLAGFATRRVMSRKKKA